MRKSVISALLGVLLLLGSVSVFGETAAQRAIERQVAPLQGDQLIQGIVTQVGPGTVKYKDMVVFLSRDGGNTFELILKTDNKTAARRYGRFEWLVTGPNSDNCLFKFVINNGAKHNSTLTVLSQKFSIVDNPAGNPGKDFPQQGDPGPQGPMGPQGPAGTAGADGAVGPQGPQGVQGPVGPAGPTGPAGPRGLVGPQGPAGEVGPQGPAGSMGLSGADGAVGPQGPVGQDGAVGPQGPAGNDGAVGPAGADGAVGPQGPAGNDGTPGADGAVGPQGPAGNDGAVGPQGPPGEAGPTGADGAVGPQGPAGADGAVGPQGPAGPKGDQGAQGPTGPNGSLTVSYINTSSTANAVLDSCKHNGTLVIHDANIRGKNNPKGRSQIFVSFSTVSSTSGVVSLSLSLLADGTVTVNISTQNYSIKTTDTVDYQIVNAQ